jgi:hypothetical protein
MTDGCQEEYVQKMTGGPAILGIPTPDIGGLLLAMRTCEAKKDSLETSSKNQCEGVLGQAGLQAAQEQLQRSEDEEVMAINAEIDQAIRNSDLEGQRASSVALIKNLRAESLLLAIETDGAQLARFAHGFGQP